MISNSKVAFSKEDYSHLFGYDDRILDALASIFHLKSPCVAAFEHKNILYISYNDQVRPGDKGTRCMVDFIYQTIYSGSTNDTLTLHLILNTKFLNFIQDQERHEINEVFQNVLLEFINKRNDLKKTLYKDVLEKKPISEDCKSFNAAYFKILDSLQKHENLTKSKDLKKIEIKENFLRPLQNVQKVLYEIPKHNIKNYVILDNKEGFHAEYNITLYFPMLNLSPIKNYIGVSKLSCSFCHEYLTLQGHKHRCTHGTCDQD